LRQASSDASPDAFFAKGLIASEVKEMSLARMVIIYFSYFLYAVLFIRVLLSWLRFSENAFTNLIFALTEPILGPIRNVIRKSPLGGPDMMIDLSPIAAFILIGFARGILLGIIK
jgi:YggT family protein